jgi:hypothetical protein
MNRVEIAYLLGWPTPPKDSDLLDRVESVVKRAVLAEREACAQACDKLVDQEIRTGKVDHNEMPWTMYCSNIIRARGKE